MKVIFTRTPPIEYAAYVEGETADIDEKDARYLIGLGVAARPRNSDGDTRHASSRTEIVGADNQTEVVVTGRGANIVKVADPEKDKLTVDEGTDLEVTTEERRAASRESAQGLVKQEAGRTGGFVDETSKPDDARTLSGEGESVDHGSETKEESAEDKRKAAAAKRKAEGAAPENK